MTGSKLRESWPRISIVIPNYNYGQYIEKAIQSVLNQDYPNLELIVLDGGSTDNSLSVIQRFAKALTHWDSRPDGGQSAAIQKGLNLATGQIFNWLNSDDYLTPGALFEVAKIWLATPYDLLIGGTIQEHDSTKQEVLFAPKPPKSLRSFFVNGGVVMAQPSTFIATDLIRRCGGIREDLIYLMDWELYLRIFLRNEEKIVFQTTSRVLAKSLLHAQAKTATLQPLRRRESFAVLEKLLEEPYSKWRRFLKRRLRIWKAEDELDVLGSHKDTPIGRFMNVGLRSPLMFFSRYYWGAIVRRLGADAKNLMRDAGLVLVSLLFAFILAEGVVRLLLGHPLKRSNILGQVVLVQKGNNIVNIGSIFRFAPNMRIRSDVFFVTDGAAKRSYSSEIQTNNLGLVQKTNIKSGQAVTLILGDSFTEGQGAEPWFYRFEGVAAKAGSAVVNGGIRGTSPLQWETLKDQLVRDHFLKIRRVNVIIVGPNINRGVWNFNRPGLACLNHGDCRDPQVPFWGYDFLGKTEDKLAADAFELHRLSNRLPAGALTDPGISFKALAKESAAAYLAYSFLTNLFMARHLSASSLQEGNLKAISRLVKSGESQGSILVVPTLDEASHLGISGWNATSEQCFEWFKKEQLNFHICNLSREDYHPADGHPNAEGYRKIETCAEKTFLN